MRHDKQTPFVVHHIGARNGSRGFPILPPIEQDIISVMYEAESDGNAQILQKGLAQGTRDVIVINACLGENGKQQSFNVNFDPFTSSLLPADSKYGSYYQDEEERDYLLADALNPVIIRRLTTEGLDQVNEKHKLPQCDFLSLDTQGSELEILRSGRNVLTTSIGVLLEVEFVPMYANQPLFGEINEFLVSEGFQFIRFERIGDWCPRVLPHEGRGKKMHSFAEALYLRSPENLSDSTLDRLVFAALAYGQTEYAMFCAQHRQVLLPVSVGAQWQQIVYRFLKLSATFSAMPPTFTDFYTVESSFARFAINSSPPQLEKGTVSVPKRLWRLLPTSLRDPIMQYRRKFGWQVIYRNFRIRFSKDSDLESLYRELDLHETADLLRRSRLR